jgi:flagellar biosynthetic protein FliP
MSTPPRCRLTLKSGLLIAAGLTLALGSEFALAQALPAVTSKSVAGGGTQWRCRSFLPDLSAMMLMMTSFTRIIIVLSLLRQALGTQTSPPNQVLVGLPCS